MKLRPQPPLPRPRLQSPPQTHLPWPVHPCAARGWTPALQFALEEARLRGSQLLVLYIREVAVNIDIAGMGGKWQEDPDARALFTRLEAEAAKGLKVNKLYSISDSPADTIIDIAATFGVDTVVLGGSRRATFVNSPQRKRRGTCRRQLARDDAPDRDRLKNRSNRPLPPCYVMAALALGAIGYQSGY